MNQYIWALYLESSLEYRHLGWPDSEMEKAADAVDAVRAKFFTGVLTSWGLNAFFKVVCLFCAIFGIFAQF